MDRFFSWSGWLIGLAGLILAYYTYRKTRVAKGLECAYRIAGSVRFQNSESKPEVKVAEHMIASVLTEVDLRVRQTGNSAITSSDVREPLRIRVSAQEGSGVVCAGMRKMHGANATVRLEMDGDDILVLWDYLDPGEEHRFELFLDGKFEDINFSGNFVPGVDVVKREWDNNDRLANLGALALVGWLLVIGPILGTTFGVAEDFRRSTANLGLAPESFWGVIVAGLAAGLTSLLFLGIVFGALSVIDTASKEVRRRRRR